MKHQRHNLDIVFRRIQPERILDHLLQTGSIPEHVNSRQINQAEYQHFAADLKRCYSLDEQAKFYSLLRQEMHSAEHRRDSVFYLLFRYGNEVLHLENGVPVCLFEQLLDWRDISYRLGQDIFTTAHLAWQDANQGRHSDFFSWPAIISMDNYRLREILDRGLSENHFHLNGSTQSFALSWACLMNHPRKIGSYFKHDRIRKDMRWNLSPSVLGGAEDRQMPWRERLLCAAWLRAKLFLRFFREQSPAWAKEFPAFLRCRQKTHWTEELIESIRYRWGCRVLQPDRSTSCLDYSLSSDLHGYNRLLSGERRFLYQGFSLFLQNELSTLEADLFYLYLLLKSQFRSEIVQVNGCVGFQNFAQYQDRKEHFWEDVPEYQAEGRRLAVCATLQNNTIQSLEARIAPKLSPAKQHQAVRSTDALIRFAEQPQRPSDPERDPGWSEITPFFYVVHFIKSPEEPPRRKECAAWQPRNHETREKSRQGALALSAALERSEYLRKRIRGIDAASSEIGCRPETFATEFRYLKNFSAADRGWHRSDVRRASVQLRATFHVGEDFLDIADGLRAIDEAMQFLTLRRGDRIGHALALGIDPQQHYLGKECQTALSRQDRLDNLVWLLFRSVELGVEPDIVLRENLRTEAENLLTDLYRDFLPRGMQSVTLHDYYESWHLRGDHPDCYLDVDGHPRLPHFSSGYQRFLLQEGQTLARFRKRKEIQQLCHLYHFGRRTKELGQMVTASRVDETYIRLVISLQEHLQRCIGDTGIMIECNPTSNYLIGTIQRYEEHPIFRFNNFGFKENGVTGQLSVSINTDDQGVFDTSLENEYALLACCMSKARLPDGRKRFSRDAIYQYLDYVRQMGNGQSFRAARTDTGCMRFGSDQSRKTAKGI